jgi:predicted Rossmann fold flavoprotein
MQLPTPQKTDFIDLAVIGGGASGFFTALQYAELAPERSVAIFEKGSQFLQKVRISGGGRCNVTHACFDPRELAKNYPRGSKELLAAFHRWQPSDTVEWFEKQGVALKAEADGRMFPVTDSSETVIECFLKRARDSRVALHQKCGLQEIGRESNGFLLRFENMPQPIRARKVCIAIGSMKASPLLRELEALEESIEPLVPSLFAFNVTDARIADLAGVSHPKVSIRLVRSSTPRQGPLLITHRGFSGPAVLRLSAWEAREIAAVDHRFDFMIDWLPDENPEGLKTRFAENRQHHGSKLVRNSPVPPVSRRLWESLVTASGIQDDTTWAQLSKAALQQLLENLKSCRFTANGKTTNKDEFVTAGGIKRPTIDFRTMESRQTPGLYFVGECVDIDGITGGFNFQAAWTTAHIAATALAAS